MDSIEAVTMSPINKIARSRRASFAPPVSRNRLSISGSSSMSDRTATTYNSAVVSTPQTSVSRRLSACDSPKLPLANKVKPSDPHKAKLSLLGFELTTSYELIEIPRWLRETPDRDRRAAPTYSKLVSTGTGELSRAEKGVLFVASAFAVQWSGRSLFENIFIFVTVGGLLWLIFGGWQALEQLKHLTKLPSRAECTATLVTNVNSEVSPADITSPSKEPTHLAGQSGNVIQDGKEKVHERLNTYLNAISSDEREFSMLDDNGCTTIIIAGEATSGHGDFAEDESLIPLDTSSEATSDETDVEEFYTNEKQLAAIEKQHELPIFVFVSLSDVQGPIYQQALQNKKDIMYIQNGGETMVECDEYPGRPIEADDNDINYMLKHLKPHLPKWLLKEFDSLTTDELTKTRLSDGSNPYLEVLALHWYKIFPGTLAGRGFGTSINKLADVRKVVEATRRKFTPEYLEGDRDFVGLDHPQRPYLTDAEEQDINEGICEYNFRNWNIKPEESLVLRQLKRLHGHDKVKFTDRILDWAASLNEREFLDPNPFHGCESGKLAVNSLGYYREEMEHNYKEMKGHESYFPIAFINDSELDYLYTRMQYRAEAPTHSTPPRSQKILQCCPLHKTETDNIFILVDTSVENINNRLSNPRGRLFALGAMLPMYPEGFKTTIGFKEISYEKLAPRCVHGYIHFHTCEECFPHGHDEDNCVECVEYFFPKPSRHRNWVLIDAAINQEREARNKNTQLASAW